MTANNNKAEEMASPIIKHRSGFSLIWLVPLITIIIGSWLLIKTELDRGPTITISFKTADGIEPGRTKIKFKNVDMGLVQKVEFSPDFSHIIVTAALAKNSLQLLHKQTRFWVVRPRLSLKGVSGLNTLVSGAYIEMSPGKGASSRAFTSQENPPMVRPGEPGVEVVLISAKLNSIDIGTPVFYQGLEAGSILGYELTDDHKSVLIHAFIKQPFDKLVQSNSRFWNVSGVDVSMGGSGLLVHMESMKSFLFGGIAFATPDTLLPATKVPKELKFTLFKRKSDITESMLFAKKSMIIAFFDGSVRGLEVGATVEFNGVKVGSVADLRLEFNSKDAQFRIPVLLAIETARFMKPGEDNDTENMALFQQMIQKGLRASLKTSSLLTGKLFVELNIYPDTPMRFIADQQYDYPEIPTIPGGLDQITASVQRILAKLEHVNVEQIGSGLEKTLSGTNKLLNGSELKDSLLALKNILRKFDKHAEPIANHIDETLIMANRTLTTISKQLRSGSPAIQMTEELADTARSIRALVDMLEVTPNSIILGKPVVRE
ncbi:MAG: MlaD family protein [Mariprofundus sp.]|nr:MlaD family protein [Mariprofundus sp.]